MEENNILASESNNKNKKKSFIKKSSVFIWELFKIVIIAIIIVLPIRYFLFQPFIVKGESMVPNLQSGDYLIIDEISYRFSNPKRGDVVVLKFPLDATQRFIKRIIGLPGETVEIENGKINILSGQCKAPSAKEDCKELLLDEKEYLPLLLSTDGDVKITLNADQYFVLGDNRQFSYDSRRWGILPREDIVGRAIFRVFPIWTMSYITEPSY